MKNDSNTILNGNIIPKKNIVIFRSVICGIVYDGFNWIKSALNFITPFIKKYIITIAITCNIAEAVSVIKSYFCFPDNFLMHYYRIFFL